MTLKDNLNVSVLLLAVTVHRWRIANIAIDCGVLVGAILQCGLLLLLHLEELFAHLFALLSCFCVGGSRR